MSIKVVKSGFFTTVQDLGRRGYQSRGVTVSGPMDAFSLRMGNAMLGNDENASALEVTVVGPELIFNEERCVVLAGANLDVVIDGARVPAWTVHRVQRGSRLRVGAPSGGGCRAYLCVSGGLDVPPVMGSRSTYTRAGIGGHKGRALIDGDVVAFSEAPPLWRRAEGFVCPLGIRPNFRVDEPILAMEGPQFGAFTDEGARTFFGEIFTITGDSDRMGFRLDGPPVAHRTGADIVSDGIVHGSVQVPGDGRPIIAMADCQTVGGYAKIAVVSAWSAAALAQRLPGERVRFEKVTEREAVEHLKKFESDLQRLKEVRATYRSRRGGWI
jgi:biotin-dependent carboxylase-like uncharacterized protein